MYCCCTPRTPDFVKYWGRKPELPCQPLFTNGVSTPSMFGNSVMNVTTAIHQDYYTRLHKAFVPKLFFGASAYS